MGNSTMNSWAMAQQRFVPVKRSDADGASNHMEGMGKQGTQENVL